MRVLLVRHGQPEDDDYRQDEDPSLTEDGKAMVARLAQWIVDHDEVPHTIVSSPMSRTQETADILHGAFIEAGYAMPPVRPDVSIGPNMSIKGLVERSAKNDDASRVMIVSHHETIGAGLRVLDRPDHPDPMAMGEMRIVKVRRKDGAWKEKARVLPSDLGGDDHY